MRSTTRGNVSTQSSCNVDKGSIKLFHADTGANCLLISEEKYFHGYVLQKGQVDVTGLESAKTDSYGKTHFYFASLGLQHVFLFPEDYHVPSNGVNSLYFSALKSIGIPLVSHNMCEEILLKLKDKNKTFVSFEKIENYQDCMNITVIPPGLLPQIRLDQRTDKVIHHNLIAHYKYNCTSYDILQKTCTSGQVDEFLKVVQMTCECNICMKCKSMNVSKSIEINDYSSYPPGQFFCCLKLLQCY